MRSVDFVYKETGVNRPLTAEDDKKQYKNQVNKIANAIREIIVGMKKTTDSAGIPMAQTEQMGSAPGETVKKSKWKAVAIATAIFAALVLVGYFLFPKIDPVNDPVTVNETLPKTIAVMPFDDLSPGGDQENFLFLYSISELAYHIPFEIDDMPIFKQRLLEAGIDPGFYKPMPVFRQRLGE